MQMCYIHLPKLLRYCRLPAEPEHGQTEIPLPLRVSDPGPLPWHQVEVGDFQHTHNNGQRGGALSPPPGTWNIFLSFEATGQSVRFQSSAIYLSESSSTGHLRRKKHTTRAISFSFHLILSSAVCPLSLRRLLLS